MVLSANILAKAPIVQKSITVYRWHAIHIVLVFCVVHLADLNRGYLLHWVPLVSTELIIVLD